MNAIAIKLANFITQNSPTYKKGYRDGLEGRDCIDPQNPNYDRGWLKGASEHKASRLAKSKKGVFANV